jgi:hypothetical protein
MECIRNCKILLTVRINAGNAGMYHDDRIGKMISEMEANNGTDIVNFLCDAFKC